MDEVQEYIERLFVHDVESIPCLIQANYQYDRVLLSGILRRLVIDGGKLAHLANRNYRLPLWVLVGGPESGNIPRYKLPEVPEIFLKYAPDLSEASCPPGMYHRPYRLQEYLIRPVAVFFKPITAQDAIILVANKLGGVHLDLGFEKEDLYEINKKVSFFGKGGVYHCFDQVAAAIYGCLAPLRDLVVERHGGNCGFP